MELTEPLSPTDKLSPKYLDNVNIDKPEETFQFSSTAKKSANSDCESTSKSTALTPNENCQGLFSSCEYVFE